MTRTLVARVALVIGAAGDEDPSLLRAAWRVSRVQMMAESEVTSPARVPIACCGVAASTPRAGRLSTEIDPTNAGDELPTNFRRETEAWFMR